MMKAFVLVALCLLVGEGLCEHVSLKMKHHKYERLEHVPEYLPMKNRMKKLAASADGYDFALGGNVLPLGIYFLEVGLGTPALQFKVALDSGSADLLVPEHGCHGCHLQNTSAYNPQSSKTSRKIACDGDYNCDSCVAKQCHFSNSYETCNLTDPTQPCTVSGPIYKDFFTLSSKLSVPVVFGAFNKQTSNFQQFYVIDGVMGFAGLSVSNIGAYTPFEKLYQAKKLEEDIFAVCMNREEPYPKSGTITLGGIDPKLHTSPLEYTPMTDSGFYTVQMKNIKLKDHSIGVPWVFSLTTILDTGTNTLLLNTPTYNVLKSNFLDDCKKGEKWVGVCNVPSDQTLFDGKCFSMTQADVNAFPPISLVMENNVYLNITGKDYLLHEDGKYCLGILPTGEDGFTIIGDIVMAEYYFVYDRGNNRLGAGKVNRANCLANSL